MTNVEIFKVYLAERILKPHTWEKDEYTYFEFRDKLNGASSVTSQVIFNSESGMVTIYGLDYIPLSKEMLKDSIYKLIHDINKKYAYVRFYIDEDDSIATICAFPFKDNFNPRLVMNLINQMLDAMENQYAFIMKSIWS